MLYNYPTFIYIIYKYNTNNTCILTLSCLLTSILVLDNNRETNSPDDAHINAVKPSYIILYKNKLNNYIYIIYIILYITSLDIYILT